MDKQVLSIEQMQELIELGIDTSNATCYWLVDNDFDMQWALPKSKGMTMKTPEDTPNEYRIDAFTLQDILEMLPSYDITYDKYTNDFDKYTIKVDILENQHYITHISRSSESLLEAAFKMLKWCKENKYI